MNGVKKQASPAPTRNSSTSQVARPSAVQGEGIVVFAVNEVYIYIPAELSAAGFELKIAGSVRIRDMDKGDGQFYLTWMPSDLTQQDVASLYSSQADSWTVIDDVVEAPVMIDVQELQYSDYKGEGGLELPDPILPASPVKKPNGEVESVHQNSKADKSKLKVQVEREAVTFSKSDAKEEAGLIGKCDAVNFPLGDLHCVREGSKAERTLTFFLKGGRELPTLHFHDGGTSGLLQALMRYLYLERDSKLRSFYYAKEFDKSKPLKPSAKLPLSSPADPPEPPVFKTITPRGSKGSEVQDLIHGVVGNFVGITRAVRQHLLPDRQLLEVRPGTENDDEDREETIQTCVLSDVRPNSSPSPVPSSPTSHSQRAHSASRLASDKEADPEASLITDFQLITDIRGKLPPRPSLNPRQPPVTSDEWERLRDDQGRIIPEVEQRFRARVFAGGIVPSIRKEVWKYLLNYYPFNMTDIERMDLRDEKEKAYWVMKQQWQAFTPDQESRFRQWRDVKVIINKDVLRTDREKPAYKGVNSPKLQQLEDILRTYAMYNFDLGYVQGMSDLLAPLLVIMDNEVDAFWCFVGFMDMVEHHFEMSQLGMRNRLKQLRALLNITDPELYQFLKDKECNNLYFCFRWLIVHFKREFPYDDIMSLWEVIWTDYLSPDFPLFVALAILSLERGMLLNKSFDFSDIMQHINQLAMRLNLTAILELAESLCYQLGSSPALPEDLQTLLVTPLPPRAVLSTHSEQDIIICSPDSRAVPEAQS